MAAHGLTILRQFALALATGDQDRVLSLVDLGLTSPGLNDSSFGMLSLLRIESAMRSSDSPANLEDLKVAVADAIEAHQWMDAYPTLEAVRAGAKAYVRLGTPYWKKRWVAFIEGAPKAHEQARLLIAQKWPLTRTAPQYPMG